jgi:DNA-binding CsgD family transcriptional regulator
MEARMVIMDRINDEQANTKGLGMDQNNGPYVYLVDNEQKMMVILKAEINELNTNGTNEKQDFIQELLTEKVRGLLERMNDNGPLSIREAEVLKYAAMGKSNKQIAEAIGLSESTVKNHFSSTLRKLNANDRTHAVTLALCHGWINIKKLSQVLSSEVTITEPKG